MENKQAKKGRSDAIASHDEVFPAPNNWSWYFWRCHKPRSQNEALIYASFNK
jgi:predicted RNA-binding Zn-ribbon protein involved in translation (DUF1610 family)